NFEPSKDAGWEVRIGYHPSGNAERRAAVAPPAAPAGPVTPPVTAPTTPTPTAPPNRAPTAKAACDPCTVEVGKTASVSVDAQDPDGDALTYRWTTTCGSVSSPTSRQTPFTAPMTEGNCRVTITVDDGHGHTATDAVTIVVTRPAAPASKEI